MRKRLVGALAALALLAAGGLLFIAAGLVPVAASSGHWPITAWFLHTTMRWTVNVRATGIEAPELDD